MSDLVEICICSRFFFCFADISEVIVFFYIWGFRISELNSNFAKKNYSAVVLGLFFFNFTLDCVENVA